MDHKELLVTLMSKDLTSVSIEIDDFIKKTPDIKNGTRKDRHTVVIENKGRPEYVRN